MYLFALIDNLENGIRFIYLIGLLGIFHMVKRTKPSLNFSPNRLLQSVFWIIPLVVFTRAIPSDFRFTLFDEFANWVPYIKYLIIEDRLANIESVTRLINEGFNQSYPPAQLLFQYLLIGTLDWHEFNVIAAQIVLLLSIFISITHLISTKNFSYRVLTFIFLISGYYYLGLTFGNILADGFLAVHFCATFLLALKCELRIKEILVTSISIFILILIKPISFVFAVLPMTILVVRILSSEYNFSFMKSRPNHSRKLTLLGFAKVLSVLFLPLFSYLSWFIHVKSLQLNSSLNTIHFKPNSFIATSKSYFNFLFTEIYGPDNLVGNTTDLPLIFDRFNISLFSIYIIAILFSLLLTFIISSQNKSLLWISWLSITLFTFLFQIFLIFLYTFYFGEVVAVTRYSVPILFLWIVWLISLVITVLQEYKYHIILKVVFIFLLFLSLPNKLVAHANIIIPNGSNLETRLNIENMAREVQAKLKQSSKVYFIFQGSDGYEKYIFSYLILPIKTNDQCWSLKNSIRDSSRWDCGSDLKNVLVNYDYLYLGNTDQFFLKNYGKYFRHDNEFIENGIYKINWNGENLILDKLE